jgi:signal transduction histidine kinase
MKIQTKLLLACGSILLATAAVTSFLSYRELEVQTQEDMAREAGNVRAMLMATRRVYHKQFLDSGLPLNDKTVGFLPAHALSLISRDFPNWTASGLYFNNVSDRPRNPVNQADAFELEAMAWFRSNAGATERMTGITAADGKSYFHYTAPLRIEEYCLKCHGERRAAPASIGGRYSEAFDYTLGDLRGVMSIRIPMAPSQAHVWSMWRLNLLTSLAGFIALFACLAYLINRLVTGRLASLEKTAGELAAGDYSHRSSDSGSDEVSTLSVAFDRMAVEVEKRDLELQRFAEVTAHHLQEPARRMASYAERLTQHLGDRLDDAEDRLSLEFIGQQARRQQNLLRDVERYLAADQPRGTIESVDPRRVIDGIVARLNDQIRTAGAEITVGNLLPARIDSPRLQDLFEVALDNALRHGRSEHALRIAINSERQGSKVRYSVSDNGPGVEEQYRERVFRVFERLASGGDAAGIGTGTGIGLAIARRIAERCGGRVWIEEASGGGCRLVFELPAGESS